MRSTVEKAVVQRMPEKGQGDRRGSFEQAPSH